MAQRFLQLGGAFGAEQALREMVASRIAAEQEAAKMQQQDVENSMRMRQLSQGDERIGLDRDQLGLAREQFEQSKAPKPQGPMSLSTGQRLVDPTTGRIIVSEVAEPEKPMAPMNLGPGAVIADPATGRIIVRNPAAQSAGRSMDDEIELHRRKAEINAQYGGSRPSIGAERQALAYFNRAKQASEDIAGIEGEMAKAGTASQYQLQYAPNILQTAKQQRYRQGQRAFTEARLRKESGAAIPAAEYENDAKTYFAQPGDDEQTIAQKQQARQTVLEGLKFASGKAYDEFYGQQEPTVQAGPKAGGGVSIKSIRQVR
jgi:hypothetical protein